MTTTGNSPLWRKFTAKFQVHQQPDGRKNTVVRDESARTTLTSDFVLMFEPSVNTEYTHTHTAHMFDWSGTVSESTAVDLNCEDGTDAL